MLRDMRSVLSVVFIAVCTVIAGSAAAPADPGSAGGSVAGESRNLSGPRNDEPPPAEGDADGFDGTWLFAGIGCRASGFLPAIISHGKIIVQGGSGHVDPDGTFNSIGAANGVTQTAVGRLSGNAGTGTFRRSNGCKGSWTAIKQ